MSNLSTIENIYKYNQSSWITYSEYNGTATNFEAEKSSIHLHHLEIFSLASWISM